MKIFLDSNVFFGDYFARNANLRYLFHFINNGNHDLLLSRLVLQEVENIRNREIVLEHRNAKKTIAALDRLNGSPFMLLPEASGFCNYDLSTILEGKVESLIVIEYEHISHSVVVTRALNSKRPFLENEKGYRDTLIWLSLLNYIKREAIKEEIVFITANSNDFFDPNDIKKFHPDLISDIKALTGEPRITPFRSVADFVDTAINKDEHAIDHSKFLDMFGNYLEQEGISYIASVNSPVVKSIQAVILPCTHLFANLSGLSAEIVEDIEDCDIISTNELNNCEVFISCKYDLRIVEIVAFISTQDYERHLADIEDSHRFYDAEIMGRTTMIKTWIRPLFTASFTYNRQTQQCAGFSVSGFRVLK